MKITMTPTRIFVTAARYTESQRSQVMGLRRELASLAKTRSMLAARRKTLITRMQSETTANPKRMLQREIAAIREQMCEQSVRRTSILSKLADLRVASIIGE